MNITYVNTTYFDRKRAASRENLSMGFLTRFETIRTVQPQKMNRCIKFWIYEVEGLFYLCSGRKNADQLLCAFVFAYAESRFSHDEVQI